MKFPPAPPRENKVESRVKNIGDEKRINEKLDSENNIKGKVFHHYFII